MNEELKNKLKKDGEIIKQELERDVEFLKDFAETTKKKIADRNVELSDHLKEKFDEWQRQTEALKEQTENYFKHMLKR